MVCRGVVPGVPAGLLFLLLLVAFSKQRDEEMLLSPGVAGAAGDGEPNIWWLLSYKAIIWCLDS